MYKYTNGMIPLIGVGGIENAQDAYERIRSGASLVRIANTHFSVTLNLATIL